MSDSETIAVYGNKADTYADLPITDEQTIALDMFCNELPGGAHVLDLGCGPGIHAAAMIQRGLQVTAIDATPEFIAAAQAFTPPR